MIPSARLETLLRRLDDLGPRPNALDLARLVSATALTAEDVAPYIRANPHAYNRACVARRDHFELLVMTWLPGQASPPHDHGDSAGVVRVLRGQALETSYALSGDGFAEAELAELLEEGAVTAFQDAGAHSLANSPEAEQPLATLHVYAPPLSRFRSFTARPARGGEEGAPVVAIVGGGYSGAMVAAHLLREARRPLRIVLIERRGALGEGVAYSTGEPEHLLNVPAKNMSAWPDRPNDFVEWAARRDSSTGPDDFLSRRWYGDYIRETLQAAAEQASGGARLEIVHDELRRLARKPEGGWLAHFEHAPSLAVNAAVLAVGHCAPADPIGAAWSGPRQRFVADPWRAFALNAVLPAEPVAVLGSGLTAVDVVLSLTARLRTAPITLISLRGHAPQGHSWPLSAPLDLTALVEGLLTAPGGLTAYALLRAVHKAAKDHVASGGDWRGVVDGLRRHTPRLWRALSLPERRRFLARVRPFWDIHRHRTAPHIQARFRDLMARGLVRIVAGRVVAAEAGPDNVNLTVLDRKTRQTFAMEANWVVNCTGPTPSNRPEANPAIASLLLQGRLRPDPLGLGVETSASGAAVAADGREETDLLVVGVLRKAALWECIAVPELRAQAARAAQTLLDLPQLRSSAASRQTASDPDSTFERG
ncbi:hypothetical protein CCR94_00440 [Rhodoblastus sphagnicola]|uniref:FAD-dependent urate hydroxylase HpyO/Asp monooxygenase CreE-like FAD/NAD(P)-binding domain-containing protein n=1 Tax=Rhodoblastus sphagnicola TaxID=333368 RepID=A0A2S6NH46_9HYPH|nr:FAD/NAD(P)-binding protein [Rhodoblastus sphagnicola]MBB4200305.1 putative NAD(P)/FAD-binding protein YdhS/predicted metal-dependent enzyme (double-stranded beta helix superfamily) [Rhodoblastus sphagnicola]PPQ33921.1 hypothetical protein CCR94_00440 [Rhodoblastus sphagnicola]